MLRRLLSATLILLLLNVLTEFWIGTVLPTGSIKGVKNVLYLVLLVATVALAAHGRRWSRLRTPADLALVALVGLMVLSGLLGDAAPSVVAQALYVYLRCVIVFYAIRVLEPTAAWTRAALWIGGVWTALNCAAALVQVSFGPPVYRAMGITDLSTAQIHRAQGFFEHPNDLGHLCGLAVLVAVAQRRWVPAGVFATGLAASQSRESLLGLAAGLLIIAVYRRLPPRYVLAGLTAVLVLAAVPLLVSQGVRTEVQRRMWGTAEALGLQLPGQRPQPDLSLPLCGPEPPRQDGVPGSPCRHPGPEREIRVLYAQQSFRLVARRPALGYGPGTFGGIVALQTDPRWHSHPRLGPDGFELYGFHGKTVDSFWLHLLVEVGLLGFAAYLLWLALLARQGGHSPAAAAAVGFAVVVALFSPALESPMFAPLLFGLLGLNTIRIHLYRGGSLNANSEATDRGGVGRHRAGLPRPRHGAADRDAPGYADR